MSVPEQTNLAWLLWRAAETDPGHAAVAERERETGYAPLRARAAAVAEALGRAGVRPGDRVGILLERSADAVGALFGVYAAGAVAVVLNERLRNRQVEHALRHAGARAVLTKADVLARLPRPLAADARALHLAEIPPDGALVPAARRADDVAQIIFTSGSSGLPKGVTFTIAALRAGVEAVSGYLGLGASDRVASLLPMSSVYGLNQVLCTVACGGTLLIERSPVAHQMVASLRAGGATVLAAVPPLWLQLLGTPDFQEPIGTLRILQNAGGHLAPDIVARVRRAQPHAKLFLQYGMTETFRSTYLPPDEVDQRPGSMGRAMPGAEILVVDEDGRPCAPGVAGELVHRGPTIAAGYWDDPEATARVFRPHPLRPAGAPETERVVFSGDLVRRDEEGFLYFVGRRDRMIKTLGFRVGPDEVVDVLHASGQIAEGVVDAEPDAERGERIVAYVVLAADGSLERLERYCRVELPRHMQAARFVPRDALPRLASGKYDLPALRAAGAVQHTSASPGVSDGG